MLISEEPKFRCIHQIGQESLQPSLHQAHFVWQRKGFRQFRGSESEGIRWGGVCAKMAWSSLQPYTAKSLPVATITFYTWLNKVNNLKTCNECFGDGLYHHCWWLQPPSIAPSIELFKNNENWEYHIFPESIHQWIPIGKIENHQQIQATYHSYGPSYTSFLSTNRTPFIECIIP